MDKQFTKAPETVVLDITRFKNGSYGISGNVAESWWAELCQQVGLQAAGGCKATLQVQITRPVIEITGTIDATFARSDVRTLESFTQEQRITVKEVMAMPGHEIEGALPLEGEMLDIGEFIREQIMLNFDEHPLKNPNSRGTFVVSDGLDEERKEEKNPFSVLKHLKS